MALSGSYNFNQTTTNIITEALSIAGVYSPGETIPNDELNDAMRTFNIMLKALQNKHTGLWLNKEYALFLQEDQFEYNIGASSTDHATTSWIKTELSAVAASGASSISIDSATGIGDTFDRNGIVTASTPSGAVALTLNGALVTNSVAFLSSNRKILIYSDADDSGITFEVSGLNAVGVTVTETITGPNTTTVYSTKSYTSVSSISVSGAGTGNIEIGQVGDHIGIELDDDTLFWTSITGSTSTTMSLVDVTTGAAAVDNHVYTYTTLAQRPLEIIEARVRTSDGKDRPLNLENRQDYKDLADKTSTGQPNQIYYDPQTVNGEMSVWLAGSNMQEFVVFTARYPIQDVDALTDDIDVPQEWYEALAWGLSLRLHSRYGKVIAKETAAMAVMFMADAEGFDVEPNSSYIQIVNRRHGG